MARAVALFALIFLALGAAPARAAEEGAPNLFSCIQIMEPAAVIETCGAFIRDGHASPDELYEALLHRGVAFYLNGDHMRALSDFERAAELAPDKPTPHYNIAHIRHIRMEVDKAIESYSRVIALNGDKMVDSLVYRGIAFIDAGDLTRALADFDAALRHDPRSANALTNRAVVLAARGDLEHALMDLDRALGIHAKRPLTQFARGRVYAAMGRSREAANDFLSAAEMLEFGPAQELAQICTAAMILVTDARNRGQPDEPVPPDCLP